MTARFTPRIAASATHRGIPVERFLADLARLNAVTGNNSRTARLLGCHQASLAKWRSGREPVTQKPLDLFYGPSGHGSEAQLRPELLAALGGTKAEPAAPAERAAIAPAAASAASAAAATPVVPAAALTVAELLARARAELAALEAEIDERTGEILSLEAMAARLDGGA